MTDHIPDEEFVETIYACLLGELSWPSLMTRIDGLLPNAISNFVMVGGRQSRAAFELSTNCSSDVIESYNSYYQKVQPWVPRLHLHPLGLGSTTDQLMPRHEARRTEYYNDFMLPLGVKSAVGVVPVRTKEKVLLLSTLTATEDPDRLTSVADLLTRLSPHLERAFQYYQRRSDTDFADKSDLLSAVGIGVVFVREHRRLRFASDVARALIEENCGITFSPTGRLRFSDEESGRRLDLLLKGGSSGQQAVVIENPALRFRYTFLRLVSNRISEFLDGPTVAILIERNARQAAQGQHALFDFHGLTPTVMRVAERLGRGETVDEVAFAHGVSRETVRTQVKSVYAKLGVSRQVELLRLLR